MIAENSSEQLTFIEKAEESYCYFPRKCSDKLHSLVQTVHIFTATTPNFHIHTIESSSFTLYSNSKVQVLSFFPRILILWHRLQIGCFLDYYHLTLFTSRKNCYLSCISSFNLHFLALYNSLVQ